MLRLRLRGPSGTATGSFDGAASIESFLVAASEQLGCAGAKMDMLVGFPPKQCEVSGAPLSSVVGSGDTVVLNVIAAAPAPAPAPAPAAAPAPGSAGPTPALSLGGMWACGACTLENEAVASACVACETPRPGGGASKAQLQKMADDNSCLFHAVAYCLDISSSPAQLREQIVRAVRAEPERWNEATLGKPVEAYCAFIADPKRWGGQVELAIFAEANQTEISVTDIQSGRADVYGHGAGYARRCYMLFSGIHFDAASVEGARTVASAHAAATDAAVAVLAAEQRSAGGFTDQATMRLRCKACGHIMVGDYEARLHAGQSGHKDFVQDR